VPNEQITIRTRAGECTLHVATPAADGSWPAVIFYMDAGGIRPAVIEMAQRLADAGYVVLLPDLFYRYGPYGPFVPQGGVRGRHPCDSRAVEGHNRQQ
jgi:carboxymethylenebutenolidase